MTRLCSSGSENRQVKCNGNVFRWWKKVKHTTLVGRFFPSYQTSLLDRSLSEFSSLLESKEEQLKQKKQAALKLLQAQILDWRHMHLVNEQSSHRRKVIKSLLQYVNEELKGIQVTAASDVKTSLDTSVRDALDKDPDLTLHQWWQKNSRLNWLNRRSDATQELDKAILWYSKSIILDHREALQQIMNAIEVWLYARQDCSNRTPLVLALKQKIEKDMASLPPPPIDQTLQGDSAPSISGSHG